MWSRREEAAAAGGSTARILCEFPFHTEEEGPARRQPFGLFVFKPVHTVCVVFILIRV